MVLASRQRSNQEEKCRLQFIALKEKQLVSTFIFTGLCAHLHLEQKWLDLLNKSLTQSHMKLSTKRAKEIFFQLWTHIQTTTKKRTTVTLIFELFHFFFTLSAKTCTEAKKKSFSFTYLLAQYFICELKEKESES